MRFFIDQCVPESVATTIERHGHEAVRFSLLRFEKCRESQAAARLDAAMSLIEHEWEVRRGQNRRMFVVITSSTIRTHR